MMFKVVVMVMSVTGLIVFGMVMSVTLLIVFVMVMSVTVLIVVGDAYEK